MRKVDCRFAIVVCTLLAFGIGMGVSRQPPSQIQSQQQSDSSLKQQEKTQPTPTSVGGNNKCQNNSPCVNKEPPETYVFLGFSLKVTDTLIAIFTLIIAIATICIFFEETDRSRRELRAYVAIPPGQLFPAGAFSVPRMLACNYGDTPARRVSIRGGISKDIASINVNNLHPMLEGHYLSPKGAHVAINFCAETPVIPSGGSDSFCLYGEIDYTDIFNDRWRHHFSWEWSDHGEIVNGIRTHNFMPTPKGNYEEYLCKDTEI